LLGALAAEVAEGADALEPAAGMTGVTGVGATSNCFLPRLRCLLPCRDMSCLSLGFFGRDDAVPGARKGSGNTL
jgi:hypothetical protein